MPFKKIDIWHGYMCLISPDRFIWDKLEMFSQFCSFLCLFCFSLDFMAWTPLPRLEWRSLVGWSFEVDIWHWLHWCCWDKPVTCRVWSVNQHPKNMTWTTLQAVAKGTSTCRSTPMKNHCLSSSHIRHQFMCGVVRQMTQSCFPGELMLLLCVF